MTPSEHDSPEVAQFRAEFARVCTDATDSLDFMEPAPTAILRHGIDILQTLPDGAGFKAFLAVWSAFIDANPWIIAESGAAQAFDLVMVVGEGQAISPPPAPITADDYYQAVRLMGMSEEDARQIADDYAPAVGRPGVMWVGDTLLYVALLSRDHEEKIRDYLKLDSVRMAQELDRLRRSIADRESRRSADRDHPT